MPRWFPAPIALGLLALTLVLWRGLTVAEHTHIERTVGLALADVRNQIEPAIATRTQSLARVGQRMWRAARSRELWDLDMGLFLDDYPSLRAIEWADSSVDQRWTVSRDGVESIGDRYAGLGPQQRAALEAARAAGISAACRVVDAVGGGKSLVIVVAMNGGANGEFLTAFFDVQALFDAVLANVTTGYSVAVRERAEEIYRRAGTDGRQPPEWVQESSFELYGASWTVRVWPTSGAIAQARTALPAAVLGFGVLLSLLMASTVGFAQQSGRRARETAAANRELATEVVERARAEAEVRRLNEDLEQRVIARTAALEAVNQDLEAFTYSVSHDLRAPLRQVDGFARLLEEQLPGLEPTAQHYLGRVQQGTRHMGHLIDDLLGLARVGRADLSPRLTELSALVDRAIAALGSDTEGRRIEWRIGRLSPAMCDPGLMTLVFANLLSNAVKFTRPREMAVIEVGETESPGGPTVFVRDNGVGFDMKYSDKLFGVFQRLHRAEEFEGTGVGLATVQRIIHRHGGRVWAEAGRNTGATFFFILGRPLTADDRSGAAAGDSHDTG